MLGGPEILAYLVLAIGGAMVVGSVGAIVKPREENRDGDLDHAPLGRSIAFAAVGLVASIWALASLFSG